MNKNRYELIQFIRFEDKYIRRHFEREFFKTTETITFAEGEFFNKCQKELWMFSQIILLNLELDKHICGDDFLELITSYSMYCLKNYNTLFAQLSKTEEQKKILGELLIKLAVFFKITIKVCVKN